MSTLLCVVAFVTRNICQMKRSLKVFGLISLYLLGWWTLLNGIIVVPKTSLPSACATPIAIHIFRFVCVPFIAAIASFALLCTALSVAVADVCVVDVCSVVVYVVRLWCQRNNIIGVVVLLLCLCCCVSVCCMFQNDLYVSCVADDADNNVMNIMI